MPPIIELVRRLLDEGRVLLREPPVIRAEDLAAVEEMLSNAFEKNRLNIAGPMIELSAEIAVRSLELLAWSCWFLLHRNDPSQEVSSRLPDLRRPRTAADHLSGDLLLRFLPQLYRRAKSVSPQDPLTVHLKNTLLHWPLSGVLADLDEAPLAEVDLDGHPGLLMLYAERLTRNPRPAWMPAENGKAYVELVLGERRMSVPSDERSLT